MHGWNLKELPLKWHYPIGLLYDLYSGAEPARQSESEDTESTRRGTPLPWQLTIHYSSFPNDQLIQLDKDDTVLLDVYINSVKEADFIRNGTARAVMSLSKEDADSLWQSVRMLDMQRFNTIQNKLLSPPGIVIKHIPLKIYLPTAASTTAEVIEEEGDDDRTPKAGTF
ncbi:hypothetical protein MRB53_041602 [Persea americana]|nr:hypothetical protein MRB53_041602 [Persea americana]